MERIRAWLERRRHWCRRQWDWAVGCAEHHQGSRGNGAARRVHRPRRKVRHRASKSAISSRCASESLNLVAGHALMPRILLVEDNAELAAAIRHNLEFEGYEVFIAGDGPAGIEAVRAFEPDAIILDAMLPRADGFQVLRTIRGEGIQTPVMMLTALGEEADQV